MHNEKQIRLYLAEVSEKLQELGVLIPFLSFLRILFPILRINFATLGLFRSRNSELSHMNFRGWSWQRFTLLELAQMAFFDTSKKIYMRKITQPLRPVEPPMRKFI